MRKSFKQDVRKYSSFKGLDITDEECKFINNAINAYPHVDSKVLCRHIAKLKVGGVSFENLIERLNKILQLGRDSSSLKANILRFGEKLGLERFEKKQSQSKIDFDKIRLEKGDEYVNKILSGRSASVEAYITRYGVEEGQRRWQQYLDKRALAYNKRHLEGYQFARYTEEYYINLYGEEKGREVFRNRIEKQRRKVSQQRYIDEFGYEIGIEICREIKDHVSLKSFVKRFGEEHGPTEFRKEHDKRSLSRTSSYQSKSATSFFDNLVKLLDIEARYGTNNEKILHLTEDEKIYLPQRIVAVDFLYKDAIIEYKGDAIHANPNLFKARDRPHPWNKTLTAKDIWKNDAIRERIIKDRGYKVMSVWESEYNKRPSDVILECIKFLGIEANV